MWDYGAHMIHILSVYSQSPIIPHVTEFSCTIREIQFLEYPRWNQIMRDCFILVFIIFHLIKNALTKHVKNKIVFFYKKMIIFFNVKMNNSCPTKKAEKDDGGSSKLQWCPTYMKAVCACPRCNYVTLLKYLQFSALNFFLLITDWKTEKFHKTLIPHKKNRFDPCPVGKGYAFGYV